MIRFAGAIIVGANAVGGLSSCRLSEEIAAALGVQTGLRLALCLRRSQGRRQVGRPRAERLASPPSVRLGGAPPSAAVLVDDVVTTGATLGACAWALRSGGCGRVVALTFARSS